LGIVYPLHPLVSGTMVTEVDMTSLEYVNEQAAEKLLCPLCLSVLNDPVVVCRNEHHLCRTCSDEQRRSADSPEECPECRERLHVKEGQRYLKSNLDELLVKCPNQVRGCSLTPTRGDVCAHVASCGFSVVKCEYCEAVMERQFLSEGSHLHCDAVRFGCEFIGKSDTEVAVHLVDCAVFKCRPQFDEYERRIAALEQTALPVGAMIGWAGATASLPHGWALCDGKHERPDRRREFVKERQREKGRKHRSDSRKRRKRDRDKESRSRTPRRSSSRSVVRYSLAYIVRVESSLCGKQSARSSR